jgi:hypothetical protein
MDGLLFHTVVGYTEHDTCEACLIILAGASLQGTMRTVLAPFEAGSKEPGALLLLLSQRPGLCIQRHSLPPAV